MAEETDDRDRPDAADERPIAGHALLAGRGHASPLGLCERERRAYDAHMFGMGFGELLVVLVIVLVVFGPGRLPEMMSHLGKGLQAFRKGLHEPPEIEKGRESNDPSKTRREP